MILCNNIVVFCVLKINGVLLIFNIFLFIDFILIFGELIFVIICIFFFKVLVL